MTPGQRLHKIMSEERQRTLDSINALPWPDDAKRDVLTLWQVLQTAVNQLAQAEDRTIDRRIIPQTLRLMADEMERIGERMTQEGLS